MDRQFSVSAKDAVILALLLVLAFVLWSNHTSKPSYSHSTYQPSTSSSHYGGGYSTGNYSHRSSSSKPATCYDGDYTNDNGEC